MLGIYIHIPYCLKKCNYCDFVSFVENNSMNIERYFKNLNKEIKHYSNKNQEISSIFIGGGTPTVVKYEFYEEMFAILKQNYNIKKNAEITIEANPSTEIDFENLIKIGINRISLGIQSFADSELKFLGRLHSANLAEETIKKAKKYFNNINVDIIYSIPNQTLSNINYTLNKILELKVPHISGYSLIYEEKTQLFEDLKNNKIKAIAEEQDYEIYMTICQQLEKNNFKQYEISNFAKENFECIHNKNYWKRGNYFGFGVAAHSFINEQRYSNISDIAQYCLVIESGKMPINNCEILTKEQIFEEKIFLGLRSDGINLDLLDAKKMKIINSIINEGFATVKENKLILNAKGKFICDEIVLKLL